MNKKVLILILLVFLSCWFGVGIFHEETAKNIDKISDVGSAILLLSGYYGVGKILFYCFYLEKSRESLLMFEKIFFPIIAALIPYVFMYGVLSVTEHFLELLLCVALPYPILVDGGGVFRSAIAQKWVESKEANLFFLQQDRKRPNTALVVSIYMIFVLFAFVKGVHD